MAGGVRNPPIESEQRDRQTLGEGDVEGVVRGEIVAQAPDPTKERQLIVSHEAKRLKIFQSLLRSALVDGPSPLESAKDLGHLDIEQVRRVEHLTSPQGQVGHSLPPLPAKEKLHGR